MTTLTPINRRGPAHPHPIQRHNFPIIIFLTVCTKDRKPILANSKMHALLLSAWKRADRWIVGRYTIMPDHVHLFCAATIYSPPISSWIRYWKNIIAREWPEKSSSRIWQRDFWDTQMRSAENFAAKASYVFDNPVRAGLVAKAAEWPFAGEMVSLRY